MPFLPVKPWQMTLVFLSIKTAGSGTWNRGVGGMNGKGGWYLGFFKFEGRERFELGETLG